MNLKEFITLLGFDVDFSQLTAYDQAIDQTFKKVEEMDSGFKKLADSTVKLGTRLSLFLTTPIMGFATGAVIARNKLEDWQKEWEALLGTEADAKGFLNTVFQMEDRQPFEVEEMLAYMKQLKGLGRENSELTKWFKIYSDISAGKGLPVDFIMNFSSQMRNMADEMGYVQGRFLMQLVKRGMLSGADLKKFFGISGGTKLPGMIKMTGEQVDRLFYMMGEKYLGAAAKKADTFNKQLRNLQDTLFRFLAKVGDIVYNKLHLHEVFSAFIGLVERATEAIDKIDNRVVNWAIALAGLLAVVGPLVLAIGGLMKGFIAIRGFLVAFGTAGAAATGWIALITAGVLGLLLLFDDISYWVKSGAEHSFYGSAIMGLFKKISEFSQGVIDLWLLGFQDIKNWVQNIIDHWLSGIDVIYDYFKEKWQALSDWYLNLPGISAMVKAGAFINQKFGPAINAMTPQSLMMAGAGAGVTIGNIAVTIPNATKETVAMVTKAVEESATSAYDKIIQGLTNSIYNQVKK